MSPHNVHQAEKLHAPVAISTAQGLLFPALLLHPPRRGGEGSHFPMPCATEWAETEAWRDELLRAASWPLLRKDRLWLCQLLLGAALTWASPSLLTQDYRERESSSACHILALHTHFPKSTSKWRVVSPGQAVTFFLCPFQEAARLFCSWLHLKFVLLILRPNYKKVNNIVHVN